MIYRSPYPDASIPEIPLADFVFRSASEHLEKPALIDGSTHRAVTYAQLIEAIARTAATLAGAGVRAGDVVAIYSPNCLESVATFYAVTSLGAAVTMLNPHHSVPEAVHQLADSGARILVAAPQVAEMAATVAGRIGVTNILSLGQDLAPLCRQSTATADSARMHANIDPKQSVAALTYSIGMTDVPLGAMLTHFNLVANIVQTATVEPIDPNDVVISMTPFCQVYGMMAASIALHAGATIVVLPRVSLASLVDVLDRYQVTTAFLVPAIIRTLVTHEAVERHDLSSLRHIVSFTAPLPEALGRACAERIGCAVRQAYGMSETAAFTHLTPRTLDQLATVGLAVPNTECRIVDVASGEDVAPGKLGEVWLRGPQVMKGYLNAPDVTAQVIDDDHWLHTCDIGCSDDEGYLTVVDRSKTLGRLRAIHRHDRDMLRAAVEEIAARRAASERLRYQAVLLDSVRESIVVTDLNNNVTFWNGGAERLFGYSAEEAIGQPVESLIIPAGQGLLTADKTVALKTRGIWTTQVRRRRKDGSELWTDLVISIVHNLDGKRVGFTGLHRDISEQRRAEEHLRFQAQLLDSVRESVVASDLEGRIVFYGKGAERLFEYPAAEMVGQHLALFALTASDDPIAAFVRVRDEVLNAGVWNGRAIRCPKKNGEFWADIVLAPVKNDEGLAVGLIAVHNDVTELRRNQELLEDSHERLRNLASRLMVIREQERSLIARELHDELGQALTRLDIDVCWLADRLPRNLKTKRVQSMRHIVGKMLKRVQHISSELRPAVLDDLGLEAAIEWHVREFADWSGCRCRLDLRLGTLARDQDRDIAVFRILQEALINIARHARARNVTVRAWTSAQEFVLEVEDDGVGIAESKLMSSQSLGLIGMRERAESLGGKISISSSGQGTVVALSHKIPEPCETGALP
jgi:PAS domain S-box-containing protein